MWIKQGKFSNVFSYNVCIAFWNEASKATELVYMIGYKLDSNNKYSLKIRCMSMYNIRYRILFISLITTVKVVMI